MTKHILVLEKEAEGLAHSLFRVPGEDDAVTQLDMVPPPADTWWGGGAGTVCPHMGEVAFQGRATAFQPKSFLCLETKGFQTSALRSESGSSEHLTRLDLEV